MTYERRVFDFLTEVHKLAKRYGLSMVTEPEVKDAGDAEQDTRPAPYIPDNDVDYQG